MPRTQIVLASTLYGAATVAAALDAGCFGPADRRLLLVSNNAAVPETTPPLDATHGFAALRDRFDGVLSWNEAISPFHPSGWAPRPDDEPMWERYLRLLWGLGDDEIELAVESVHVEPALALVQLFPSATVDVYADGLMSYGPTRNKLEPLVTTRIRRLLHPDLVPGLRPLLLSEYGVEPQVVPTAAFVDVLEELAKATPLGEPAGEGPAVLLGQYLAVLGILTADEEERLHVRMLRGAAARGHRTIVFKPHPSAPARWSRRLEKEAADLGVELTVFDEPVLAEVLFQQLRPALVVGCFSTALFTASALYGIPVARTGTDLLLRRLTPYQNSNRVPVTIAEALLPALDPREDAAEPLTVPELTALLRAVGFCMQAKAYPKLRVETVRYLARHRDRRTRRYFGRRRLVALALPGGIPSGLAFLPRSPLVRRVARRTFRLLRLRPKGGTGT
ncbi:alpha-2,8-polysialyltransferase family protein [Streptomyces sp. RB6PN25]|uniref:Alpha-2,8-polysialyltransferase family protein n=1 Tax=Streptomyces humicola TaxID=2953240 RepID=A0ABT1PXY8_9ACTN|nr:alpha-2,8-polysialyltransferase family protein [Streptomyces humicola]MCQ4082532.1 alpha-2,8-polysialyltransferase family protein [Streptomyces humicola]